MKQKDIKPFKKQLKHLKENLVCFWSVMEAIVPRQSHSYPHSISNPVDDKTHYGSSFRN